MCRTGGRRCPSHSNPLKVAEYNAVRRERYAAQKTDGFGTLVEKSNSVVDRLNNALKQNQTGVAMFPDFSHAKPFMDGRWGGGAAAEYRNAAKALSSRVQANSGARFSDSKGFENYPPSYVLGIYTMTGHIDMREYLNRDNPKLLERLLKGKKNTQDDDRMESFKKKIDFVMNQVEKPAEPRLLYRGMIVDSVDADQVPAWIDEKFPVGGVISQKNYMSTSLNAGIAVGKFSGSREPERSVVFEIVSKQGAPLGEGLSNFSYEETEVLMPREAKFKVVSVDKNVDYTYQQYDKTTRTAKKTVIRLIDVSDEGKK